MKRRIPRANKLVISTNNLGSQSLKRLSETLSTKLGYKVWRVRPERVNGRRAVTFNKGVNKLDQFNAFHTNDVSAPKFVTTSEGLSALNEFKDQRYVARKLLNSSSGNGIVIFKAGDEIPRAPLYTQYIPKKREFRVHVFNNRVIDAAEKRKRREHGEDRDTQIRNTANGYVFCRDNLSLPDGITDLAVNACRAINRTQGAVDIIWNEKLNKLYVLEVNSIPGMEGTTLEKYAEAIING